jgi:hypothetical protein
MHKTQPSILLRNAIKSVICVDITNTMRHTPTDRPFMRDAIMRKFLGKKSRSGLQSIRLAANSLLRVSCGAQDV